MRLAKHYNVQPSELERMPYWEYELFLRKVNDDIKEENKRREEEEKGHKSKYKNMNPNSMMNQARKQLPKMPSTAPKMPSMPHF